MLRYLAKCLLLAGLLGSGFTLTQAGEVNLVTDDSYLSVGTFFNHSGMNISLVGTGGGAASEINWDHTFGDGNATRFRIDGTWRITPRHHVRLMFTDFSHTRSVTIDRNINWGDDVIPVSATVKGGLGFSILEGAYEYAFLRSDRYELSGSAGLHYTKFKAELSATIQVSGSGGTQSVGGPAAIKAPLPVIGVHGLWQLGHSLYLDAQAQYFALSIDNIDGSLSNYRAAVIWQPSRLFGVGAGYDAFNVNADFSKSSFTGTLDWTYKGPQVFVNFLF